jgi:hypothetical protein
VHSSSLILTVDNQKRKAKTVSRPLPKRNIFPFMELPAEIRNMIYTYALTDSSGINLQATFKHKRRTVERISAECQEKLSGYMKMSDAVRAEVEEPMPLAPSLLAVSKQIHSEGLDILYGNEFIFADSFALYAFLINVGPACAKHLKTIRLLGWGWGRAMKAYNHSCFAVLVWATNITAFHVDAYTHSAQQLYRDAFPWLEAIGSAKGKADAAVDVLHLSEAALRYYHRSNTHEDKVKAFKAELSKFLDNQQKRVMAKPVKKRKLNKEAVANQL